MPSSAEVKEKICADFPQNICCRRSLLKGVLFARGETANSDKKTVTVRVQTTEIARFVGELVLELYGKPSSVSTLKSGGRVKLLTFESPAAAKYLDSLSDSAVLPYKPECQACEAAFLRGVFLGSGRLTDPEKDYALEFSCEGREKLFLNYFTDFLSLSPKLTSRRNERFIRFRSASDIESFFALASLNEITFAIINQTIECSIRSEANRTRNLETVNIDKAMAASVGQVSKLRALQEAGLFGMLPDDLADTAKLRLENETLSLSQLAALTTPKLSKSGLSHRLERIMKECDVLLKKTI